MQSCWVKVLIAEAISLPLQSTRQLQERAKPNGEVLHHLFLTFPSNLAVAPSCTRIFRGGRVNAGASAGTGGLSVRDVLETRVDVTSFTSPMMWTVKEKKVVIQKLWWLITYITVTAKNHIRSRLSCMYTTFIYIVKVFSLRWQVLFSGCRTETQEDCLVCLQLRSGSQPWAELSLNSQVPGQSLNQKVILYNCIKR